jgi:DNA-binding MltR family transcriptional regulator
MNRVPKHIITTQAVVAGDRRTVSIEFVVDGEAVWTTSADAETMDALIESLGHTRVQLLDPIPDDVDFSTPKSNSAFNPRWRIVPDSENKYACLWIRHPGLGWHGYMLPRHEAGSIAKHLIRTPLFKTAAQKLASLSPQATAFGNEEFLITTEGLGFYYFGKGKSYVGTDPFEQIEFDSDRSAGIVAGSVVDQRLVESIKTMMITTEEEKIKEISDQLFRPSGPLGSFSNKIQLAFAFGIISTEAYEDLLIVKNIRNDFAHHLNLDTFDAHSIRDRCRNLKMIDKHVGPVPPIPDLHEIGFSVAEKPSPYLGFPDYQARLANPRFRYVMTAQLINFKLGTGSNGPNFVYPMI